MSSDRPQFSSPLTNNHINGNNPNPKPKSKKKRDVNAEKNEAKRARLEAEEEEEARLTGLIFGGGDGIGDEGVASAWHDDDDDEDEDGEGGENNENGDDSEGDDYDNRLEEDQPNTGALFTIDRDGVSGNESGSGSDADEIEEGDEEEGRHHYADESSEEDVEEEGVSGSAWVDDDDEQITVSLSKSERIKKLRKSMTEDVVKGSTYEQRLRERFQQTASATSRTDWATLPQEDSDEGDASSSGDESSTRSTGRLTTRRGGDYDTDDSEDDFGGNSKMSALLSSTAPLLANSKLQSNILSVVRCPDANAGHYNDSVVKSVQFHPGSDEDEPLMLTAGLDKTLRFFKINGSEGSKKVHGIHFPNLPIHTASFLGDTGSVVVSGRRPFFYIYDMISGKIDKVPRIQGRKEKSLEKFTTSPDGSLIAFIGNDGYIILVEAKSKMWVADFKMNGSARAVSFSPCGDFIISSGSDGDVYRWDLRSKKCVDKFQNQDGTITSFVSATSRFTAVGAESGVVNLYHDRAPAFKKRTPVKSIMNLQTSIDHMKFNPTGDILAMSSQREKDSLKLLHVPTQTVFSNWPTSKTPLGYVWSIDFSPKSKFMAIGNDKGKCMLYKLQHYD